MSIYFLLEPSVKAEETRAGFRKAIVSALISIMDENP